ncbi:MAG: tRNA (5-methylaminomethyl-2-thiouridine)(34)-methyltransferase MnmD [Flavobacteriales bacterium]|nr:tRNA (5-methylaminomethyl-2-thiouridine)(34)-methyltransferase MnmD [Flavobacteriales bacterium]
MLKIIHTNDGSHSLFNEELNETYHSIHGALAEAEHVFIKNGFHLIKDQPKTIFELGFGTGLNVLLTLLEARKLSIPLTIHSIEAYPVPPEIISEVNYPEILKNKEALEVFQRIHTLPWDTEVEIFSNIRLKKIHNTIESWNTQSEFDCVYFDAFAPNKQEEIWSEAILKKMYDMLKTNGHLTTYCAQGQFKRNLKKVGFSVESISGPPGKKEMTLAYRR